MISHHSSGPIYSHPTLCPNRSPPPSVHHQDDSTTTSSSVMSSVPLNCPVSVCNFPPIGIPLWVVNEGQTGETAKKRGYKKDPYTQPPARTTTTFSVVVIITIHLSLLLIEMYGNKGPARNNPELRCRLKLSLRIVEIKTSPKSRTKLSPGNGPET